MNKFVKKYLPTALVIVVALAVGFVAGCTNKNPVSSAETKSAPRAAVVMPDSVKGVHQLPATGTIDVAFSPNGGVTNMITSEIGQAKQSVQVQAYSFTSNEIIQALIQAKKRGVDVRIILDKSNVEGGSDDKESPREKKEKDLLNSLVDNGVLLKVDSDFQIAHSKIMIIDGKDVITGSFNFTYSAEHNNAENCLILRDNKALADQYMKNWQWRWDATPAYAKR